MNNISTKRVAQALVLATLVSVNSLQSRMGMGLQNLLGLTKDEIRALACKARESLENQPKFEMAHYEEDTNDLSRGILVQSGTVTVGVDNDNQPIVISYLKAGLPNHNLGTILCAFDGYFGNAGYKQQIQKWALKGYQAYTFDLTSNNSPTAMQGVGGFDSYSYHQYAYFLHQALVSLNIPTNAQVPITITGLDTGGTIAFVYAHLYKNDPLTPSFLVLESPELSAVTSNNPCDIPLLSIEFAEILSDLYIEDPCGILCLLYSGAANQAGNPGNFTEIRCPSFGNFLLNLSVRFGVASTTPEILRQRLAVAFQYNPSSLMKDIEIPVLMLYSGIYQLLINKQVNGIGFYGFCAGCEAGCSNTSYILPFKNSILQAFQDAGLALHVARSDPFNKAVIDFISGDGGKCDPYFGIHIDDQFNCAPCPQV